MLDTLAKAPIQAAWGWLQSSWSGILDSPNVLMKCLQAVNSLVATCIVSLAAAWFIAVKATEVTIIWTGNALQITASDKSA